ncbi:MAG: CPBP family intramembrane metalloprotease, partial [Aequorivita sp.]|nr:CPBP family intramembrane metalloprotease [Aequorivita sp.]
SRKKIDWGRVFFGFALIAITTTVVTGLDYYNNPEDYVLQFNLVPFVILAIIAIIMIPLQTSFEEYLFRGYLMQGIGVLAKNKWLPLLITSVVFGGLHLANPEVDKLGNVIMIFYIGTGFFLGIMTLMDEGMELALGFHAGNNLIAALLVTADWTVFKTNSVLKDISEPSAGFDVIAPVLILYPILLLIMAWRYKWTDWGGKLFGKVEEPNIVSDENAENQTFIE